MKKKHLKKLRIIAQNMALPAPVKSKKKDKNELQVDGESKPTQSQVITWRANYRKLKRLYAEGKLHFK
jgi:hypothetical protein